MQSQSTATATPAKNAVFWQLIGQINLAVWETIAWHPHNSGTAYPCAGCDGCQFIFDSMALLGTVSQRWEQQVTTLAPTDRNPAWAGLDIPAQQQIRDLAGEVLFRWTTIHGDEPARYVPSQRDQNNMVEQPCAPACSSCHKIAVLTQLLDQADGTSEPWQEPWSIIGSNDSQLHVSYPLTGDDAWVTLDPDTIAHYSNPLDYRVRPPSRMPAWAKRQGIEA